MQKIYNMSKENNTSNNDRLKLKLKNLSKNKILSPYERSLAKAMEYYYSDDFNKALNIFEIILNNYKKEISIKRLEKIYFFTGASLENLADMEMDIEKKDRLYNKTIEKYKKAIKINPNNDSAYNNWGYTLGELADIKEKKEEKEGLYNKAIEKYQKAIGINPKFDKAYYNWGTTLEELADIKEEKEDLYNKAIEKYQKAIGINPKFDKVYDDLGYVLMQLAKLKQGKEKKDLLNEAEEKLIKFDELKGKCYNLACVYALTGEKDKAFYYLEKTLINGERDFNYVENDEDFDNLREEPEYKRLKEKYGSSQETEE